MKKNNKKGFTIVELVIVIAVIAILAAVLIPTFANVIDNANKSAAEQNAMNIYKEGYALDIIDGVIDGNKAKDTPVGVDGYTVKPATETTPAIATAEGKAGDYTATVTDGKLTTPATKTTNAADEDEEVVVDPEQTPDE